jgi:hypothetical protein
MIKKILFYLPILNLIKFLIEDMPKLSDDEFDSTTSAAMDY